jgi:hypothetical protein
MVNNKSAILKVQNSSPPDKLVASEQAVYPLNLKENGAQEFSLGIIIISG